MIDPDEVGAAARRLAAKMIADQAVPVMCSLVAIGPDPSDPQITDKTAVVVVARGPKAIMAVLDFVGKPRSMEIEGG